MKYYVVPRIGTGADDDPHRPDVPNGTSWVGRESSDGTYLIFTPHTLPPAPGQTELTPVAPLAGECDRRSVCYDEVIGTWYVAPSEG